LSKGILMPNSLSLKFGVWEGLEVRRLMHLVIYFAVAIGVVFVVAPPRYVALSFFDTNSEKCLNSFRPDYTFDKNMSSGI